LYLLLSASQPHGSGSSCLFAFTNPSHFVLLNTIGSLTFPVSLPAPLATHHPTRHDSFIDLGAV